MEDVQAIAPDIDDPEWWNIGPGMIDDQMASLETEFAAAAAMGPTALFGAFLLGATIERIDPATTAALAARIAADFDAPDRVTKFAVSAAHRVRAGLDRAAEHYTANHPTAQMSEAEMVARLGAAFGIDVDDSEGVNPS